MQVSSTMSSQSSSTAAPVVEKGVAGRINYAAWDKVATDLVQQVEQEDQVEIADQKAKVCLCECVCVSIDMCVVCFSASELVQCWLVRPGPTGTATMIMLLFHVAQHTQHSFHWFSFSSPHAINNINSNELINSSDSTANTLTVMRKRKNASRPKKSNKPRKNWINFKNAKKPSCKHCRVCWGPSPAVLPRRRHRPIPRSCALRGTWSMRVDASWRFPTRGVIRRHSLTLS